MCMLMHVYIHMYMCLLMYVHVSRCGHMRVCEFTYLYVCVSACVFVSVVMCV